MATAKKSETKKVQSSKSKSIGGLGFCGEKRKTFVVDMTSDKWIGCVNGPNGNCAAKIALEKANLLTAATNRCDNLCHEWIHARRCSAGCCDRRTSTETLSSRAPTLIWKDANRSQFKCSVRVRMRAVVECKKLPIGNA
jgi:hypothetical protein